VINENPLLKTSIIEEQDKLKKLHQDLVYRHFPKETVKIETGSDQHVSYHSITPTGEIVVQSRIENGNPVEIICRYADQIEADLVIVGSRGLGEMGALVGSISEKIVRKSSRSILVVKTETFDHAELEGHHHHRKGHVTKA
jgi:nucleotide-binding universal stress UspA family protein